jgi:tetratricopeptide (TPR) repeat protein
VVLLVCLFRADAAPVPDRFNAGIEAYRAGDYARSAQAFRDCAAAQPSAGALRNLGNAEWQRGRTGEAILAWERALWVNPFDRNARNNLRYARATAQLEAPELTWAETASTWLPLKWWAWTTAISLWLAVGMMTLPGVLRWRRAPWQQAVTALALGLFLLTLPAHVGALTRLRLGFVLPRDTPLRLTPTADAETLTRLGAGEPAREIRVRGRYRFIRTSHASGWVERDEFARICGQ